MITITGVEVLEDNVRILSSYLGFEAKLSFSLNNGITLPIKDFEISCMQFEFIMEDLKDNFKFFKKVLSTPNYYKLYQDTNTYILEFHYVGNGYELTSSLKLPNFLIEKGA